MVFIFFPHDSSHRGIPFAQAPTGRLRWEDPEELGEAPWPGGRLDATQHRPFCPQYDYDANQVVGDEDCLFLNVFTPFLPGEVYVPLHAWELCLF